MSMQPMPPTIPGTGNFYALSTSILEIYEELIYSGLFSGLAWKQPVRVATTANLVALSGIQTVDGVLLVAGDRILVKDQLVATENGIYTVSETSWERPSDATLQTVATGNFIYVKEGTLNATKLFYCPTITVTSYYGTALQFVEFSNGVGNNNVIVQRTTAQSIPNSLITQVTGFTVVYDGTPLENGYNAGSSSIVCRKTGTYQISGTYFWQANVTGDRTIALSVNGTNVAITYASLNSTGNSSGTLVKNVSLVSGDLLTLTAFQDSGIALNIGDVVPVAYTVLSMIYLG